MSEMTILEDLNGPKPIQWNNFQFVKAQGGNAGVLSVTEKIR